ncbi:hypothetical protein CK203_011096 [Vitis vinifera]|uniref:Uncharacterized protein n=1 Tax=Vitis vinifera TaxID=29760 RepID=A0A438JIR7_VITVI|nr:hypothetical protein CK203_011096 [Vitis vinifera]
MRIGHRRGTLIFVAQHYFSFTSLQPRLHRFGSHFPLKTLVFSMAEAVDNPSSFSGESDEDFKYGFQREEMYKASIAGTVDAYDRHVFLCFKSPKIGFLASRALIPICFRSFSPRLSSLARMTLLSRSVSYEELWSTKFTICEGRDGTEFSDGDVLIFPEMIKYKSLKDSDVDSFVDDVIVNGKPGPLECKRYGYVTPNDVPELLDQHIGKGEIIERIWRGQMGSSTEEGEKVDEQKLPNGKDQKRKKKHQEDSPSLGNKESVAGCCQGADGVSCCRDATLVDKCTSEEQGKKVLTKLSHWMGTWEQGDVFATIAVVGAVATVAVAYSLYRRSG